MIGLRVGDENVRLRVGKVSNERGVACHANPNVRVKRDEEMKRYRTAVILAGVVRQMS